MIVRSGKGLKIRREDGRAPCKFESQMERPNILWIVTTQWRAQALGYAGDPNARTPRLDALAAESVNFTQAVTPHPMGPMARAALLTGVASPENGVRDYWDALPAGARTIAHELRERGYATAFFGKWGVGRRDPAVPLVGEAAARVLVSEGERGGFHTWQGFDGGFLLNDPWLHGTRLAEPEKFKGYQPHILFQQFWDEIYVGLQPEKPQFMVVSLETPHPPYDAPAGDVSARDPEKIMLAANVPRGGEAEIKTRRELAGYHAHIEATDDMVGRTVAAFDEICGQQNSIVVFTSVHGDMHGAHGLFRKGWPHEESIRVPLLVRHPAEPARRNNALFSLLDLRAMTLAWADNETAKPISSSVESEFQRISMPTVVPLPHQCDRVWRGVRTRNRKLVFNADGSPWLFFNLGRDPLEQRNLVNEPAWKKEIKALARQLSD
jgi:arylsulfatase A-like enzyme